MSGWGAGATIGTIYQFKTPSDLQRLGHCWMSGRVRVGDYALCISHSGDCFYKYILIERMGNGMKGIPGAEFGAYFFGEPAEDMKITNREHHLLCAGEFVKREKFWKQSLARMTTIVLFALFIASSAHAQEAPKPDRFANLAPYVVMVGGNVADLWSTQIALSSGHEREMNPLIAGGGIGSVAVLKLASTAGFLVVMRVLETHGHRKAAHIFGYVEGGVTFGVAAHNLRIAR